MGFIKKVYSYLLLLANILIVSIDTDCILKVIDITK